MTPLLVSSRRRARVLHVGKFYPPYKGGMETHLRDLCHAISPYVDVSIIVSNNTRRTTHEFDGNISITRIGSWGNVASAPICPGMADAIRRSGADIVHLHCPNPAAVMAYLAAGQPGYSVITYQSDIIRQRILRFAYEPWLKLVARRSKAIVCLSPNYVESSSVVSRFREKCHVIPHGIDPARFERTSPQAVADIRARFGNRIVLAVGRLVYYKGFEYLIRAIAATNATLVLIGSGPLREHLFSVAQECGVAGRVHLLGEVDDVVPYYHAAKVFVLPSVARSEAFGIVQLEAMACGTPVINTRLDTGVPFVSLDGVSGLTVPPSDVAALAEAIETVLNCPEIRERFAAGARARIQEHFTLSAMTEQTLELYDQILSEGISKVTAGELATASL